MSSRTKTGSSALLPLELLATARVLLAQDDGRAVSQADLRRCVSTVYYALFHAIAACAANLMVGPESTSRVRARSYAYRAIDHGTVKRACLNKDLMKGLSEPLLDFADLFARMQAERHKADYDPDVLFFPETVRKDVEDASIILDAFVSADEHERRVFLAFALFKPRT